MSGHVRSGAAVAPRLLIACTLSVALTSATGCAARAPVASAPRHDAAALQALVNDLKARVPIPEEVQVTIVPANPLLVSAESSVDRPGIFLLRVDEAFLDGLTAGELEAVIAHELGHIWIFTHHPYLQTEALANRIAMRVVTRDSLVGVYEKVWQHGGTKGDLTGFLGLSASADAPGR